MNKVMLMMLWMVMMLLTLMLASMENPQKQMRANPSVTWDKELDYGDENYDDQHYDDENYDDNGDASVDDDVNDDYDDAGDEADGKELATFPLGTKLAADNLKIPSFTDDEILTYIYMAGVFQHICLQASVALTRPAWVTMTVIRTSKT